MNNSLMIVKVSGEISEKNPTTAKNKPKKKFDR